MWPAQLGLKDPKSLLDETKRKKTLAYYREAICDHIGGKAFDEASVRHVASILRTAAENHERSCRLDQSYDRGVA